MNDTKLKETYKILEKSDKPLTLNLVFQTLVDKKLVKDDYLEKSSYWSSLTTHIEIFTTLSSLGHAAIGLRKWVPQRKSPTKKPRSPNEFTRNEKAITLRIITTEKVKRYIYSHKLTYEELKESFLSISSDLLSLYKFSGEGFPLTVYCYGDFSFKVWVNAKYRSLHASDLLKFYQENKLKEDDIVYLEKRTDDPVGLHLYTKWQKYGKSGENVKKKKVETTQANKKGMEQELGDKGIDGAYLLALIQKKDLVYKYLLYNGPAHVYQIANAISKTLSVRRNILDKLSFIDLFDERIIRLRDGRISIKQTKKDKLQNKIIPEKLFVAKAKVKFIYAIVGFILIIVIISLLLLL